MSQAGNNKATAEMLPIGPPERPRRVVVFGEALWDLLPDGEVLGGAPLNFAYRMSCFGHDALMVTALGVDERGGLARAKIRELGLSDAFVSQVVDYPTGTVDVHLGTDGSVDYTINPNVAYDFVEATPRLLEAVEDADALCFGTLAQRRPVSRRTLVTLATLADSAGDAMVVYDVNLRKDCFSAEVVNASIDRATVVKLNEDEVAPTARMTGLPDGVEAFAAALIAERKPACCIVTLGERGAYVTAAGRGAAVYVPGFNVSVTDPLGAGDAFTAGFVSASLEGRDIRTACLWGNAAGAIVASQRGATQPFTRAEVAAFLERCLSPNGVQSAKDAHGTRERSAEGTGVPDAKAVNIDPRFESVAAGGVA